MAKKFWKVESSVIVVVLQSITTSTEPENLGPKSRNRKCEYLECSKSVDFAVNL